LKEEREKALVVYLTAGCPSLNNSELIFALEKGAWIS
jgi:tryptophan synthase alpha subunit